MNLVIFGASGATGKHLVAQALCMGHHVTAFVRDLSRLTLKHEELSVIQGNVKNYEEVEQAIKGQDVVISALGVSHKLKSDPDVIQGVINIVRAMQNLNVKRLVYESTFSVHDHRSELGFFVDRIAGFLLRHEIYDHEQKEELIRNSRLDYVIVRPARLTHGHFTGKYRHGERIVDQAILPSISRADVADFMLHQLNDDQYLFHSPRVMM